MNYRLAFALVAGVAAWAVAKEDVVARTTKLVERWVSGDKAARAGVVAETHALGEPAIAELYRRIGVNRLDFPGIDPGVVMSKAEETPDWSHLVNIEVAFVTPPKDAQLPKVPTVLDAEQRKLWLERGERISAPRLTAYNGQRCNVTVLRENGYVRTFEKGKPVAGAVRTGLMVEMRPRYDVAERAVELELRYIESKLEDGIAKVKTPDGEIGMPMVSKREVAITVRVPNGKSVALAVPGEEPMLLTIKATGLAAFKGDR